MNKKISLILVIVGVMAVLAACSTNIFNDLHEPRHTVEAHIANGNVYLNKGENTNAREEFSRALELDADNADALYGHARATVREKLKLDIVDLAQNFTDKKVNDYLLQFSPVVLQSIYDSSNVVRKDLGKIAQGQTHGFIKAENVYVDLGLAYALEGISYALLKAEELRLLLQNNGFIFENLNKLKPEDINDLIKTIDDLLPQAQNYLDEVATDQGQKINDTIKDVRNNIDKYKIELGVDNDGDGKIDEEFLNGIDDDSDGLTDEDSTGTFN
ncbi:MAG: tetratricopeptide repeat protein [bacterium]